MAEPKRGEERTQRLQRRARTLTPPEALGLPPYEDLLRESVSPAEQPPESAAEAPGRTAIVPSPTPPPPARPESPTAEPPQIWVQRHRQPAKLDGRLVMLREPDSWRSACLRVLRHRLVEPGDTRVIAVTSAERGEGKTTCAANLAIALGECERATVLLVEANQRCPSLASLFGYVPPMCFSKQMARHKHLPVDPWSVVEVYHPSLHVAAMDAENGGRPLLDGPAFAFAMEAFKRSPYDYIVVDTPPVLGSADVNLVQACVDGVLLVTWARRSSARALRRAVEQLTPARLLGITLLDA